MEKYKAFEIPVSSNKHAKADWESDPKVSSRVCVDPMLNWVVREFKAENGRSPNDDEMIMMRIVVATKYAETYIARNTVPYSSVTIFDFKQQILSALKFMDISRLESVIEDADRYEHYLYGRTCIRMHPERLCSITGSFISDISLKVLEDLAEMQVI